LGDYPGDRRLVGLGLAEVGGAEVFGGVRGGIAQARVPDLGPAFDHFAVGRGFAFSTVRK